MDNQAEEIEFEFNEMLLVINSEFVRKYPSLMRFSKLKSKKDNMPKWVCIDTILTLTSFLEYNFDTSDSGEPCENYIERYHIFDKSEEPDSFKISIIRMLDYFELNEHQNAFVQQSLFPYISLDNCDLYLYEALKKMSVTKNLDKISGNWLYILEKSYNQFSSNINRYEQINLKDSFNICNEKEKSNEYKISSDNKRLIICLSYYLSRNESSLIPEITHFGKRFLSFFYEKDSQYFVIFLKNWYDDLLRKIHRVTIKISVNNKKIVANAEKCSQILVTSDPFNVCNNLWVLNLECRNTTNSISAVSSNRKLQNSISDSKKSDIDLKINPYKNFTYKLKMKFFKNLNSDGISLKKLLIKAKILEKPSKNNKNLIDDDEANVDFDDINEFSILDVENFGVEKPKRKKTLFNNDTNLNKNADIGKPSYLLNRVDLPFIVAFYIDKSNFWIRDPNNVFQRSFDTTRQNNQTGSLSNSQNSKNVTFSSNKNTVSPNRSQVYVLTDETYTKEVLLNEFHLPSNMEFCNLKVSFEINYLLSKALTQLAYFIYTRINNIDNEILMKIHIDEFSIILKYLMVVNIENDFDIFRQFTRWFKFNSYYYYEILKDILNLFDWTDKNKHNLTSNLLNDNKGSQNNQVRAFLESKLTQLRHIAENEETGIYSNPKKGVKNDLMSAHNIGIYLNNYPKCKGNIDFHGVANKYSSGSIFNKKFETGIQNYLFGDTENIEYKSKIPIKSCTEKEFQKDDTETHDYFGMSMLKESEKADSEAVNKTILDIFINNMAEKQDVLTVKNEVEEKYKRHLKKIKQLFD